jgi:hypothetical protein
MKRKALLIGNTDGLPGVKNDLVNFSEFLKSNIGGAWNDGEIEIKQNVAKSDLQTRLAVMKLQSFDYSIVLFSGHGGFKRTTLLQLNERGETIDDSALKGLSTRQLSIFDCCRSISQPEVKNADHVIAFSQFEGVGIRERIRKIYDERIMSAISQQNSLYSCSIGEVSYDDGKGAVYLNNFIKAAMALQSGDKLVGRAHQEAAPPTLAYSKTQKDGEQNPDHVLPKCLYEQQLIISLKPNI